MSSISKDGALLAGHAKDPVTAGLSLDALLGKGYFGRTGGHVLCFGAGGSTTAIALHLAQKQDRADRPRRVIVVNRSAGRLGCLRKMVAGLDTDIEFEYHCNVLPEVNDEQMGKLPPASLLINATGMGKDLPGSPITDGGLVPIGGVAWELNNRGELRFLHQALAQRAARQVRVEDGSPLWPARSANPRCQGRWVAGRRQPSQAGTCDNLTGVLPMDTTRLSTKGQIVLPKGIRVSRAWGPGTEFTVEETGDGIVLRPAARFPGTDLEEVAGCLRSKRKSGAPERMRDAIGREVMRRHARGRY